MKKLFFLVVAFVCVFVIQGCTRASSPDSAKIQIQLPSESSVVLPKAALKNGGLVDPTTLDEINCYGVFVGGPDEDLKNKTCALGTSGESFDSHSGGEMVFGDWKAAIPSGQILSMEVKPGVDRVIYLIGMKTTDGGCVDFRDNGMPDEAKMSSAFLLGIAGRLELKAGAETKVQIPMSLNSGKTIVGCRGDEFLRGGDGGGENNTPYLRFEGIGSYDSVLDVDKATVGECYAFRPAMFKGQGGAWVDSGGNEIHINVAGLNIGQFYSASGCVSPVTDLVIPAGQSKSVLQYYFKSTTAVTGTLANVVFSGNTDVITGAQQKFDVGQKKIVITGPNRVVLNECYPYKIMSSRYEGGFLNTDASGAAGTLSENASFNLRTGSDCSAGTSANIAPYTNETMVHLKLLSPVSVNFADYITMSGGYTIQSFMIDASARADLYDSLAVKIPEDKIIRGQCNEVKIHLVNNDGGAVKARFPIDIKIKGPQGAGVFYTGPGCIGGTATESVQIATGDTSVNVWFSAHFIPAGLLTAGKMPIYIDSGSLKLNGIASGSVSVAWIDVVAPSNNRMMINPPSFSGANIVGSHEFLVSGSILEIPLWADYEGLQDVQCSATSGTGFSSCSPGEVDRSGIPYKYKWTAANASGNTTRYVRFSYSGYNTQDVAVSSTHMYGPNFKVINCTAVGPAGASTIAAATALNAQVLCIPASAVYSKTNSTGYSLDSVRQSIIGHSSGTSVLSSAGFAGNVLDITGVNIAENRYIANIQMGGVPASSTGFRADSVVASTTATVYIDNVNVNSASSSAIGFYLLNIANDLDLSFSLRNVKAAMAGTGSYGILLETASRIKISEAEIAVSASGSYGIKLNNSIGSGGDTVEINNSLMKTTYGMALAVYNTSTSTGNNNIIRNSRFVREAPGNAASEIVRIEGKFLSGKFDSNLVLADTGAANTSLMSLFESGTTITLTMIGNTFVQSAIAPGILFDGNNNVTEFSKNSFAYTGTSTNNSFGAVRSATAAFTPSSSIGVLGGNISCGVTTYVFSPFNVVASGSVIGSMTLGSIPSYASNVVTNTGRCRGL